MIAPKTWKQVKKEVIPLMEQDIAFVYKKIHNQNNVDSLFKSMNLKRIGLLGHSFGGRAVAQITNQHQKWFQALATLDMEVHMGSFVPLHSTLPSMHILSSYWKSAFTWLNLHYRLNRSSFLVTLSSEKKDIHYSYHMNFTDFSTLQYLAAYQDFMAYKRSRLSVGEDVLVQKSGEDLNTRKIRRPLYLIKKNNQIWNVYYHEPGKKRVMIDLENIPALKITLNHNSKASIKSQLRGIKQIIHVYHQDYGHFLGTGDGIQITHAINRYLINFFDAFLKHDKQDSFKDCLPLTSNTRIQCGPGVFY
ncbi:TPA: hypothetical protein ACXYK5_003074 [Legionella pneumophila]